MIRLPPALRVAIATRYHALFRQNLLRHHVSASSGANVRAENALFLTQTGCRPYATVHAEDTNRLWRQYGKDAPAAPANNSHGNEEITSQPVYTSAETTSKEPSDPAQASERKELIDIIKRRGSPTSRRTRRRKQHIEQALTTKDSLAALRALAYPQKSKSAPNEGDRQTQLLDSEAVNSMTTEATKPFITSLLDVKHIQDTKPLPTQEEYPNAPASLFSPATASGAIHNACQGLKLSLQADIDYSEKTGLDKKSRRVNIPDTTYDSAVGEGTRKLSAKQAAWLHLTSKMHVDGALKELFPDRSKSPVSIGTEGAELDLAHVDQETQSAEKDAKTEIFNYAASLGKIPLFEVERIQGRVRRDRKKTEIKRAWRVTISLDEIGIKVSAANRELRAAEIAAAVTFKEQAEAQAMHTERTKVSLLTTETAKEFFEFYKNRTKGVNIEVEHELKPGLSSSENSARLTVDGKAVGCSNVSMRTKTQAEAIAYLTAAVDITKNAPELLLEFEHALERGKGKVLRPLRSIDLEVEYETLSLMRKALVEARNAGLADSREALEAESFDTSRRDFQQRRRLSTLEQNAANERLMSHQQHFDRDPSLEDLRTKKHALPMNQYRDQVLKMVSDNQYSVVVGHTGSGKTTQVPQILFEDAIKTAQGALCNIICTQPRRIAATSVARRVAEERNESLQQSVGHHVRFDHKPPREPFGITYCTTGILLERLKNNANEVLDTVSHVIIDEVHERDIFIDFLMIVLKRAIRVRQADGRSVPKVVLMSATVDAELFAEYFSQRNEQGMLQRCPSLSVPGRTFPVQDKYLDTVMEELREHHGEAIKAFLNQDTKMQDYLRLEEGFSATHTTGTAIAESVIDWKRERQQDLDVGETSPAQEKDEALIPVPLVAATIAHICATTQDGAVLAFLPGEDEILAVKNLLLTRSPLGVNFSDPSKYKICILHSKVSKELQDEVFQASPFGHRKIILSTNIAETSVTVTDVKHVVDTGKLREKRYDQTRRITKLQTVWESKSNSKQRAGRAGRVQDGFYYALFSKERATSFRAVGLPELLRSDLQETCLSIKAQNFREPVASFLAQAIEPPPKQATHAAINNLVAIEAFTEDEDLTALGRVLSKLPVHPTLGKMIILGIVFRCLDPMIILGAAAEQRSLFLTPLESRAEARRTHHAYAGHSRSDQIALLEAFREIRTIKDEYGTHDAHARAYENYLHVGAFRAIDQTAKQIEDILFQSRLITRASNVRHGSSHYGPVELNRNSANHELVKCLLLGGLYPNLAAKTTSTGTTLRTPSEQNVLLPTASLNAEQKRPQKHPYGTLFAYSSLHRSNDGQSLFLRESTHVTPLMATLFGGHLRMTANNRLEMDEWLPFFVKAPDRQFATKLLLEFRKALDRVLHSAFRSLSDFDAHDDQMGGFADDPVRDQFANRVVEILGVDGTSYGAYPENPLDNARGFMRYRA
ncbi:hypothetical protein LTR37_014249 [Vermiconidia calcicola]|uniref:Uncharacterized protein n=1 Tax=Vermiconidia calcicola TaxID=1690605 RepID=A0ACC3MUZ3_9PEZI|nr:hypothetical protein LTR37_014249 [Vermiconidia calcicola]